MRKQDLTEKISNGKVIVLRPGEERETAEGFFAPATITLIHDASTKVAGKDANFYNIVDTGCFGEEEKIKELLEQLSIKTWQVPSVYITHNHPDHVGCVGLFNQAKVIMPDSIFAVGRPNYFELMPENFYNEPGQVFRPKNNNPNIEIISTPGHSGWDFSVLYKNNKGKIAIVGDLFWSQEDWEHDSEYLGLCVNPEMQKRSRSYVREKLKPEMIVPGHGHAFKTKY